MSGGLKSNTTPTIIPDRDACQLMPHITPAGRVLMKCDPEIARKRALQI
jgi:hypothetical protein